MAGGGGGGGGGRYLAHGLFGGAGKHDVIMTSHKGRYWPGWGGVLGACMNGGIMLLRKQVN